MYYDEREAYFNSKISVWLNTSKKSPQVLELHTILKNRFLAMNIASRCNVYHYKYPELKL